ncbi:uncharacterized protein BDR25DRAFT_351774 [Lindgomyces ingoldianus]|uniref:Uncharacterized protein n=1 Tax=Lindgomyces ingoldianus TaxID=673940 RepID=A0ACB6R4Y3_9PLEO|nr:uncharacterized protein BDR25DRAFT_351774 [Lindgomyces ingoldianus]KAF2474241.1 hypothetical protein BDR25DRAFT_351774 [Lindgomyces ingoldianus]
MGPNAVGVHLEAYGIMVGADTGTLRIGSERPEMERFIPSCVPGSEPQSQALSPSQGSEPQPRLSVYATHPPGELRSSSPALSGRAARKPAPATRRRPPPSALRAHGLRC